MKYVCRSSSAYADRINFAYLSTPTRASGLLVGASAAFVWRPWRRPELARLPSRPLDVTLGVALGVLGCAFVAADVTSGVMYPWVLALTALASVVAIAVVVHPAASGARLLLGNRGIVAVGRRSYGLYLWHWPIFMVTRPDLDIGLGHSLHTVAKFLRDQLGGLAINCLRCRRHHA